MSLAAKSDQKGTGEDFSWVGQPSQDVTQLILSGGKISPAKFPGRLETPVTTESLLNSVQASLQDTGGSVQIKIEPQGQHEPAPGEEFILINSGIAPKNEELSLPQGITIGPSTISVSAPNSELPKVTTAVTSDNCNLSEQMLLQVVDRFVKGSAQELAVTQPAMVNPPQQVQLEGVTIEPLEDSAGNNTITVIADNGNTPQEVLLLEVENLNGAVAGVSEAKTGTSQVHQVGVMNHELLSSQMLEAAIYAIPEQMLSGDDILHGAINQAGISYQQQLLIQQGLAVKPSTSQAPTVSNATTIVNGRQTHPCGRCNKTFLHRRSLKRHLKSHMPQEEQLRQEGNRKRCEECGKTFSQVSSLNRHKRHTHEVYADENGEGGGGSSQSFRCMVCDKRFKHAASLGRHFSLHTTEGKPYKCPHCEKSFRQRRSLKKHLPLHAGKGKQCPHCWMNFRKHKELKKHIRTHTGISIHKCKHCEQSFSSWSQLKAHKRVHSGDKPYRCLYCHKAFSKKSKLAKHHEWHLNAVAPPQQYLVDAAAVDGSDEASIIMTEHHPSVSQLESADMFKPDRFSDREGLFYPADAASVVAAAASASGTSQVSGYPLNSDPTGSSTHGSGRSPTKSPSRKKSKSRRKDKKKYRCRGCKKKLRSTGLLRLHEAECSTSMPHRCTICGKRFTRMNNLKIHQRVHTGFKPFKCQYCQKTFSQGGTLKRHERIHTDERPYTCKFCNETFKWSGHLRDHERKHLADEASPCQCKTCRMVFMTSSDLRSHERTHGDTSKPHVCLYCAKSFRQGSELTSHLRVHTGERPFQCKQCDKAFKYRSNLYEHEFLHKRGYTKRSKGPPPGFPKEEITLSVDSIQTYATPDLS